MSTMHSQIGATAFQSARAPAVRQPAPETPATTQQTQKTATRHNLKAQNLWLILIVAGASLCVATGVLYLSSYASLTREAYRRVHLQAQLQAEIDKNTQFQQVKARVNTTEYIEQQARKLGMVPAKDGDAFVVGQSR